MVSALEYVETLNAGSLFDPLCAPGMPPGGVKWAAKALVRRPVQV
jgi:hypothetical protein